MFVEVQVGAQTETELKEKKLRVEDALNATKVRLLSQFSPRLWPQGAEWALSPEWALITVLAVEVL